MLGRRERESPSQKTEAGDKNWFGRWEPPAQLASKATDLDALRTAVVDAAGVGYGLWFSYLFALLYFAIAAGAVTHRDLLLESPVKLPFLNVELPLKAFFILGPLVFLVMHAYVLLHFLLLAGKVGAFHIELEKQVPEGQKQAQLRRQLPSNIFVQFLAGPREVREGIVGFLLKAVATISLVAGPIALLVLFQLQFLPYHNPRITWWHRIAMTLDLVLLWLLWPPIARGETALITWYDLRRVRVAAWLPVSLVPLLLAFTIATFPGEWLEENIPPVRLVPMSREAWQLPSIAAIQEVDSGWATLHELLVARDVDPVTGKSLSLWSNVLVLPNFEIGERSKFDEGKSTPSKTISLRGRRLEGAVFVFANLRKADFTGAQLAYANFSGADLKGADFCNPLGFGGTCAQLQGAWFAFARLQGASFDGANLQCARFHGANLHGASLENTELQAARFDPFPLPGLDWPTHLEGASLRRARLQAADLRKAHLQGASLDNAQLQGVAIEGALLQNASLKHAFLWRVTAPAPESVSGAAIVTPITEPKYRGLDCPSQQEFCDWSRKQFEDLKDLIKQYFSQDDWRKETLRRIEPGHFNDGKEDLAEAEAWDELEKQSQTDFNTYMYPDRLVEMLKEIGCSASGAPFVISGLIGQLNDRFPNDQGRQAKVADKFLDMSSCDGARNLSEDDKADLMETRSETKWLPKSAPTTAEQRKSKK